MVRGLLRLRIEWGRTTSDAVKHAFRDAHNIRENMLGDSIRPTSISSAGTTRPAKKYYRKSLMRNTVSQSGLMAPERSLTVALKSSSATHTNRYLSLIAAIPPQLDHQGQSRES